jgi:hypothetical protein
VRVAAFVADVLGFVAVAVVVVVFCGDGSGDDGDEDDAAADDRGVAVGDGDNKDGFTVFGIPHIRDSVVLTTFRSGLLGSHIFALSPESIVLLDELLLLRLPAAASPAADDDDIDDGNCCANTWVLLQIAKTSVPTRNENTVTVKVVWFMLNYVHIIFIYIEVNFLCCYNHYVNTIKEK